MTRHSIPATASSQAQSQQPRRVEILSSESLLEGFVGVDRATFRHQRFDGEMSPPMVRLVVERGDAVAVLPYDQEHDEVVLVRQFRYPAYVRGGPGWLWEIIAGVQEQGRSAEEVARREALEEAGYRLERLAPMMTVYPSPGACSERIAIYLALITPGQHVVPGGGLASSGEDIRACSFPLDAALRMAEDGRIMDAKTILALQYLALHRRELW